MQPLTILQSPTNQMAAKVQKYPWIYNTNKTNLKAEQKSLNHGLNICKISLKELDFPQ